MRSSVKLSIVFKMLTCALGIACQAAGAVADDVAPSAEPSNLYSSAGATDDRSGTTLSSDQASRATNVTYANPLWGIPVDLLVATRDLPLFSPSRQPVKKPELPFQAPAVALVVERITPPNISLVGVIMRGDSGVGLFADNETKSLLRLDVGESYNGWKLVSVVGRRVTLQRKDARVDLALASASDN